MEKLLLRSTILAIVLIGLLFGAPAPVVTAASPSATQAVLSLTDLGAEGDILMRGPFESTSLRFDQPPTWLLQSGGRLLLDISLYVDYGVAAAPGPGGTGNVSGALLDVFFNDKLQQSLPLMTGENLLYTVPISVASLKSPYSDGRLQITFSLNATRDCLSGEHTTMKIAAASQLVMPYTQTALQLDLRKLPWPIYLPRAQSPGQAALVSPAAPTASQLSAALLVMGAFGRMSNTQLPLTMFTADQLTDTVRNEYDLIFVGPASAFPMLQGIDFPVAVTSSGYSSNEMQKDDGLLEMAASPWNNERSLLVVGGNSDAGLVKAAQALTTGNLQTGSDPTYSIVQAVTPNTSIGLLNAGPVNTSSDYKLSDLGYSASTGVAQGTVWFTYNFIIPTGQVAGPGPYLDVIYSYSTLVDPKLSSADVYLNGQRVGGMNLEGEPNSAKSHVPLPSSLMTSGTNTVEVAAALLPKDSCSMFSANNLWMTILPESVLHLPLVPAATASNELKDLKSFPRPFNNDPSLSTVVFVLPEKDTRAWAQAGQVAYNLGAEATGSAFGFNAAFDGKVPENMLQGDLIIVGLPAELSILQQCKDVSPAYFAEGSNVAIVPSQEVVYHVPPGKDLGYLELFASPWNSERAVLGVLGTTADGTDSAGEAITTPGTRDTLRGNFATVDGTTIIVIDTRTGFGLGQLTPEILAASTLVPQAAAGTGNNGQIAMQAATEQRQLVLTSLAGILLLIAIVVGVAIWVRRRNRTHTP